MNIIIDLIIKIFQAVFEEDRKEREQRQARLDALRARQRQAQSGEPEAIEQFFQGLFGEEAVPPKPRPRQQAPPQKPQPARPRPQRTESYEEHLARIEERSHLADERAAAMDQHVEQFLGKADGHHQQHREFKLPGRNPLEQALYAGIIFGPCKARQKSGTIKTL